MKIVYTVAALSLCATLTLTGCQRKPVSQASDPVPFQSRSIATDLDEKGVMSGPEYLKLVAIQTKIFKERRLDDPDIALIDSLLKAKSPIRNPVNETERHRRILLMLAGKKKLTPMQADRLFTLTSPFLKDENEWVRSAAVRVVASTRDPRALPLLENLARTDSSPDVLKTANEYAQMLRKIRGSGS